MAEKTYLICEVSEGMFPHEKCVVIRDTDGGLINSGFFSDNLIKDGKLLVHVYVVGADKAVIGIPGHDFFRNRTFTVPKSLIVVEKE